MTESDERPTTKDPHAKTRIAFAYLQKLAATGEPYSDAGMAEKTGWTESTAETYRSKHWSDWLKGGEDLVSPTFEGVSEKEFIKLHHQPTDFYGKYQRKIYPNVVTYEFLLPLTKERELTKALDSLFYSDTVERLVREFRVDSFRPQFFEDTEVPDTEVPMTEIVSFVAEHFTGYSITHVSGRFRAAEIARRKEAGSMLAEGERYLVDETTAVVRFIVPLQMTAKTYNNLAEFHNAVVASPGSSSDSPDVKKELAKVRRAFFLLFAEAVVRTVKGEDQVWLLESGLENRLYIWEKA